jgi:2-polyprenyl-3-methyl-5-hydroxy-6-metoxy-1,4-benzoquinol methylase
MSIRKVLFPDGQPSMKNNHEGNDTISKKIARGKHTRIEMRACAICQNDRDNKVHTAHEMLLGLRESFEYIECASCGCLQIKEIPDNLSQYYPQGYYSYKIKKGPKKKPLRTFLRRQRSRYCLNGKNTLWCLRSRKYGSFSWFKKTNINFDSAILDVGCGNGKLINRMQRDGFRDLTGVDPFIKESLFYRNGVRVLKKDIFDLELNGQFDLIMSHHSFEHMPQPLDVLKKFHALLKAQRFVLIRTPVADSFAWRRYGVNWFALDAPRHLILHTPASMELLSAQAGFIVADIEFDSTEEQFLHSELYLRNIPFKDKERYLDNPHEPMFSKQQIEEFNARASELNDNSQGDQACFYLYKQ